MRYSSSNLGWHTRCADEGGRQKMCNSDAASFLGGRNFWRFSKWLSTFLATPKDTVKDFNGGDGLDVN